MQPDGRANDRAQARESGSESPAEEVAASEPAPGAGEADESARNPEPTAADRESGPAPATGSLDDREGGATQEPQGETGGFPSPSGTSDAGDSLEPGVRSDEGQESAESLASLREEAARARGEAEAEREAALRVRAEMENLRKRTAREVEQAHRYGVEGLVAELLPVRDSLELGIQAADEAGSAAAALAEGTRLTLRMLASAMEKHGAVEVDPEGEGFDPRFHQAMSMREVEGVEAGRVVQVVQKGCTLHGRVVRPAMVIVSK